MEITLTNDFHGTKTTIRVTLPARLSARRVRDIKARLCGVRGCTCSGQLGTRGKQAAKFAEWGQTDGSLGLEAVESE